MKLFDEWDFGDGMLFGFDLYNQRVDLGDFGKADGVLTARIVRGITGIAALSVLRMIPLLQNGG